MNSSIKQLIKNPYVIGGLIVLVLGFLFLFITHQRGNDAVIKAVIATQKGAVRDYARTYEDTRKSSDQKIKEAFETPVSPGTESADDLVNWINGLIEGQNP